MLRYFDIVFYVKGKGSITVVFRHCGSSVGFLFHRKHQNLRFSLSDRFICFSQDDLEDGLFNLQWELLCLHVVGSKQQLLYATATAGKTVETAPWPTLLLLCAMNLPRAYQHRLTQTDCNVLSICLYNITTVCKPLPVYLRMIGDFNCLAIESSRQ